MSDLDMLKSYHHLSPVKHVTIRAQSDVKNENAIDWAIDSALDILANIEESPMILLSAIPTIRQEDGVIFVTVLARAGTTTEIDSYARRMERGGA